MRKRTKLIIDKTVQGALFRRLVFHWLAFILLSLVLATIMQWMTNPMQTRAELARGVWNYYGPFLILLLALIPAFIVDTLKLSHRFVGPISRFRNVIQQLQSGQRVQRIKFRERDFWQDIADGFNVLIDRIEKSSTRENCSAAKGQGQPDAHRDDANADQEVATPTAG